MHNKIQRHFLHVFFSFIVSWCDFFTSMKIAFGDKAKKKIKFEMPLVEESQNFMFFSSNFFLCSFDRIRWNSHRWISHKNYIILMMFSYCSKFRCKCLTKKKKLCLISTPLVPIYTDDLIMVLRMLCAIVFCYHMECSLNEKWEKKKAFVWNYSVEIMQIFMIAFKLKSSFCNVIINDFKLH